MVPWGHGAGVSGRGKGGWDGIGRRWFGEKVGEGDVEEVGGLGGEVVVDEGQAAGGEGGEEVG